MNKVAYEEKRKEKNIPIRVLCKEMGIDESTYYRKMQKNGDTFTAPELNAIVRMFDLAPKEAVDMLLS